MILEMDLKHFSVLRWHNVNCCQQMTQKNTAEKRGFVPVCFPLLASVVYNIQLCMGHPVVPPPEGWVLLNGSSPRATSSGTLESSFPADSIKRHFPNCFTSIWQVASAGNTSETFTTQWATATPSSLEGGVPLPYVCFLLVLCLRFKRSGFSLYLFFRYSLVFSVGR